MLEACPLGGFNKIPRPVTPLSGNYLRTASRGPSSDHSPGECRAIGLDCGEPVR